MSGVLTRDLFEWLRIPSVSTGGGNRAALEAAAAWACRRIRRAGGEATVLESSGNPLVIGRLSCSRPDAPTVLIYGHYDVQGPGDDSAAWTSPPFDPQVRDGRIYARGAADDKGNFLPLLHAACELHAAGALPVNVSVLIEGDEEVSSAGAIEWVRAEESTPDAAVIFDAGMLDEHTPAITLGMRGLVRCEVSVRTADDDLHSGLFGGAALNAAHALHAMLARVLPDHEGRVGDNLSAGELAPAGSELAAWEQLPSGARLLEQAGARPLAPTAEDEFYRRTWASAALDVNSIRVGEPRSLIPARGEASISIRVAPGQRAARVADELERLLRAAAPANAEVSVTISEASDPVLISPDEPAIRLATEALADACGAEVALVRSGGSVPIVAELAGRGVPVVACGFTVAADSIHGTNESFRLEALQLGEKAAGSILQALAAL